MGLSSGSSCLIQRERWAYAINLFPELMEKSPALFLHFSEKQVIIKLTIIFDLYCFSLSITDNFICWQPDSATPAAVHPGEMPVLPEGLHLCSLLGCYPLRVPAQPAGSLRLESEAGPTFSPPRCWREPTGLGAFRHSSNTCSLRHRAFSKVAEEYASPSKADSIAAQIFWKPEVLQPIKCCGCWQRSIGFGVWGLESQWHWVERDPCFFQQEMALPRADIVAIQQ